MQKHLDIRLIADALARGELACGLYITVREPDGHGPELRARQHLLEGKALTGLESLEESLLQLPPMTIVPLSVFLL